MSIYEEDEWSTFWGMDHFLPMVTSDAVASALHGFRFTMKPEKDFDWLAVAVRRALATTVRMPSFSSERTSNADVRADLERLGNLAATMFSELFQCDYDTQLRLLDFAWEHWNGEGSTEFGDTLIGNPPDFRRFQAAIVELNWLSSFMRQAAMATEKQHGPWRQSEQRQQRIERGRYLAPIFEAAFGQPISANNWSGANWSGDALHKEPTAFMDFYQRIVALAFGEKATPDLSGVLKAARKLHETAPVKFNARIIPGL